MPLLSLSFYHLILVMPHHPLLQLVYSLTKKILFFFVFLGLAIAFAPQLINWWQPDEFAAERAQRVKLVYSIIDRSIDAFRLIPQVY